MPSAEMTASDVKENRRNKLSSDVINAPQPAAARFYALNLAGE
jgi:hypothetical protein